ncbi:YqjK-like family protein [Serratia aquatilis]|uniref:YqjK-like family protein n=1 Tax=Serratia aquatilis TaxID=1737515 RepID=A0ABV6EGT0_9GAMM
MNHRQYREWKKEQLIRQIQQQRLELTANKVLWLEKTERIDHSWQTLFALRKYIAVGSSIIALYGIRHPSKLIRWSRRALSILGTARLIQKTFFQR